MYLCIGVALVGMVSYLVCIKTDRRKDLGIYFLILAVSGVFGVLICLQEDVPDWGSADEIRRPEPGSGTTEEDYVLSVEDLSIEEP